MKSKPPILTLGQIAQILGDPPRSQQKSLAISANRKQPPPLRVQPPRIIGPRPDRMTILAGIICKHCIVVGADSQLTDPGDGGVAYVNKINAINFHSAAVLFDEKGELFSGPPESPAPPDVVLIAECGLPAITNRAVDIIREKATFERIASASSVIKVLESSVREMKADWDEDQKSYTRQFGAAVLLAFYVKNAPHLYTCDIAGPGIAKSADGHYVALGLGATLANYLLAELADPNGEDAFQIAAMIYTIAKVKQHNAYCGGDINISLLHPVPHETLYSPTIGKSTPLAREVVDIAERWLIGRDEQTQRLRNKQILKLLQTISKDTQKEYLRAMSSNE
jgi:20S proteasome alpha/beta subunit